MRELFKVSLKGAIVGVVYGTLFIGAVALAVVLRDFEWTNATLYEGGQPILPGDISTTIHCGVTQGGPYEFQIHQSGIDDTSAPMVDLQPLVDQYGVGTFYCVGRHVSNLYGETSGDSNEINFSVTPQDVGLVPLPPTEFRLTVGAGS